MLVRVLLFGVLRDLVGTAECEVDLAEQATAGEANRRVASGRGGAVWETLAVAVNEHYAGRDTVLKPGDVVALLPPVSGG